MITQFEGESRYDAVVNHFSLSIDEEESFFRFLEDRGIFSDDSDEEIIDAHKEWLDR